MTVYTGGGAGTFIEVAVPVNEGFSSWERHYHFRELSEVKALFKTQHYEFFSETDECYVEKCADEAEEQAIVELWKKYSAIALERNQKGATLEAVQASAKRSREWLQFYNDVLAGAPHILESVEFHTTNISYTETTAAQLQKDIDELTCD